jgi:hypothetical protein
LEKITMRTIQVSAPVWEAIAERGRFGETEDDVLRRVFAIPPQHTDQPTENIMIGSPQGDEHAILRPAVRGQRPGRGGRRYSTVRISSTVQNQILAVSVEGGPTKKFPLSDNSDKASLRQVRDAAFSFAREHGATQGQLDAITKALNIGGYYLFGPKRKH